LGFTGPGSEDGAPLVIPLSAPLITGRRAVVYVQDPDDESRFSGREIALGPRTEGHYVVDSGLEEGELVVTNGSFKLDSALQIVAKPSMMSPGTGEAPHASHEGEGATPSPDPDSAPERLVTPTAFSAQLEKVFGHYLQVQKGLAADDLEAGKTAVQALPRELATVDETALSAPTQVVWIRLRDQLRLAAGRLKNAGNIESAREAFEALSDAGIRTAKTFGTGPVNPLHVVHCPMAFGDKGADWLQREETVANPYFGASMLRCGFVKETIAPAEDGKREEHHHE